MLNIYKFRNGLNIIPRSDGDIAPTAQGDLAVSSVDGNLYYNDGSSTQPILTGTSSGVITNKKLDDSTVFFVDTSDNTKEFHFNAVGTTGTKTILTTSQTANRILTLPDITDTLVGKITTDTFQNKSIDGGSNTLTNISLTTSVTGILPIANGGTSASTKTAAFNALQPMTTGGDLIYGGASGTGLRLGNGTIGQVLTSGGGTAAPTWTTPSPGFVNPMTTIGDIIVGGSSGTATRLGATTNGFILTLSSGTPAWAANSGGAAPTSIGALDGQTVNAQGLAIASNVLYTQSADATHPGMVNNTTQTFSGAKTFSTSVATGTITDRGSGLLIQPSNNQNFTVTSQGSGRIIFNTNAVDFGQTTTPSNPASGKNSLYFKADNNLYTLTSSGVETIFGPGISGSNWKNDLTFTFGTGFGTVTNINVWYRRVGDSMQLRGYFTAGTVSAAEPSIIFPGGYTIDTAKTFSTAFSTSFGTAYGLYSATTAGIYEPNVGLVGTYNGSSDRIQFVWRSSSDLFVNDTAASLITTGTSISFDFNVPITGWSVNNGLPTTVNGEVFVTGGSGMGAVNTGVRRFTNIKKNAGTSITYADDANNGGSFTINEAGIYSISYTDGSSTAQVAFLISNNSDDLTSSLAISDGKVLASAEIPNSRWSNCGVTLSLNPGDVIRAQGEAAINRTGFLDVIFRITQVSN